MKRIAQLNFRLIQDQSSKVQIAEGGQKIKQRHKSPDEDGKIGRPFQVDAKLKEIIQGHGKRKGSQQPVEQPVVHGNKKQHNRHVEA